MAKKKKKAKIKRPISKKKTKSKSKKSKSVKSKKIIKKNVLKPKKAAKKEPAATKEEGALIGKVTHYFPHVKAGAILIQSGQLSPGDAIRIKGHTTDFKQKITSLQVDRNAIDKASKGQEVGILVKSRVRIHDKVYKI